MSTDTEPDDSIAADERVPIRVLLVEDDPRIRRALALSLSDEGYAVEGVPSGEDALRRMDSGTAPDVVLLDLMLPGVDGFTVCRTIRQRSGLPVIMVTARSDTHEVIAGLEAGADDYVTKPLDAAELAARIRALLRRARPGSSTRQPVRIGEICVDLDHGVATRQDLQLHLTKTEARLLVELVAAHGRVVTRDELLSRVWQYDYFGDTRLLDVHISRLRRKIEADPNKPRHILTVRGSGYRAVP